MDRNPIKILESLGQSIWLDYIRRDLISSGRLQRLIEEDGLSGLTSNTSIFEKSIAESNLYDTDIQGLSIATKDFNAIYEAISQQDLQNAADLFRPLYEKSNGGDGYVSLEVNPHLAYDTLGTIEEGYRLWATMNRPNILIKVPATVEGIPAIRQLISEGINVNVTLLFSLQRYRQVADAFIAGIKDRINKGKSPKNIVSVASFSLSRLDTQIDPKEVDFVASGGEKSYFEAKIRGQVAISIAKIAYKIYRQIFESEEFLRLGALPQRLLWASTTPQNPDYSDLKYVEALIGPNTVHTITLKILEAYRDRGKPESLLEVNLEEASLVWSKLSDAGINMIEITEKLESNGVEEFIQSYNKMIGVLSKKTRIY
jgi:transaldolase